MKKYRIYLMILLVAASFVGCDDQLTAFPGQSKVDGNVIIDQKSAEVALNGVYYCFVEGGDDRDTPSTRWAKGHEIVPNMLAGYSTRSNGGGLEENSTIVATSSYISSSWKSAYTVINAANGVIKQMEPLPADMFSGNRKAEIIAESRLMRAYGHYNLLRFFSQFYDLNSEYGVMLRKEFVTATNIAQKRSSVKATYEFILEDIEDAIQNAPLENKIIYANKWIAKGMKARVLMMRGAEGDYKEVINLTSDVIKHGPYQLEEQLKDIFKTKGLSSAEVMLGIEPMANQVNRHDAYAYNNSPEYIPTLSDSLLLKDDPRMEWMIDTTSKGKVGFSKYWGDKIEVCYAMRLTEMYLLKAEAIVRSGGELSDAKDILKEVMGHAGITDFTTIDAISDRDELLFAVYQETARNLSLEDGIEWSALIRLPMARILEVKPAIMDKNYIILPIPADEFDKNPMIGKQNPGYSKN